MSVKLKENFVLRKVGPMYMAVPFGALTREVKGMISLTESGYLLWQEIKKGNDTVEGLSKVLCDTYEVPSEQAAADVQAFLDGLREQGALEA